jgi:hypothetical protein
MGPRQTVSVATPRQMQTPCRNPKATLGRKRRASSRFLHTLARRDGWRTRSAPRQEATPADTRGSLGPTLMAGRRTGWIRCGGRFLGPGGQERIVWFRPIFVSSGKLMCPIFPAALRSSWQIGPGFALAPDRCRRGSRQHGIPNPKPGLHDARRNGTLYRRLLTVDAW